MPRQVFDLVLVEWEDSYSGNHSWFDLDTLPESVKPIIAKTAGFLVLENRERVTLAFTFSHDSAASLWTIPRKMIRSIETLRADVVIERSEDEE